MIVSLITTIRSTKVFSLRLTVKYNDLYLILVNHCENSDPLEKSTLMENMNKNMTQSFMSKPKSKVKYQAKDYYSNNFKS